MEPLPPAPDGFATPVRPDPVPRPAPTIGDHVVAFPREADSVLVCWGVSADGVARARASLGEEAAARLVLRLYAIAGERHTHEDTPLDSWIGQRVATIAPPGARVVAAVGLASAERFVHIVRAAAVRLPPVTAGAGRVRFDGDAKPTIGRAPKFERAFAPAELLR